MSAFNFSFDPKQAGNGFEPIPVGEYEFCITDVEIKTFSSGNEGLKLTLTVRDDIAQEGQKRKVFDNLVASEKAMFKFHQLFKALGYEAGASFASLQAIAQDIKYKYIRAKIKHESYTSGDGELKVSERIAFFLPSTAPGQAAAMGNDPFKTDGKPIDISDDDLPF